MTERASADQVAIGAIVREINEAWRAGEDDRIGSCVHREVVIAPPAFDGRVRGRDAYVQSYRDYDESATTLEFSAEEPQIDVIGNVGVAVSPFDVVYELRGKRYHEQGFDILVFARVLDDWRVLWRTTQTAPIA